MIIKHNKREHFEQLFWKLSKECGEKTKGSISKISDYALLYEINIRLAKLGCILFTRKELEQKLSH